MKLSKLQPRLLTGFAKMILPNTFSQSGFEETCTTRFQNMYSHRITVTTRNDSLYHCCKLLFFFFNLSEFFLFFPAEGNECFLDTPCLVAFRLKV